MLRVAGEIKVFQHPGMYMADETITFSELRKIQKREDRDDELSDLDDKFLLKVADYLETKREVSGESSREYRNAKRVFDKIIGLREEKVVKNARIAVKSEADSSELNLLPSERQLFLDAKEYFKEHRDRVEEVMEGGSPAAVETETDSGEPEPGEEEAGDDPEEPVPVRITSQVPEFMGTDLESYGPFEEGDRAEIPRENAEILVNRGSAEEVEN